MQLGMIGLGRMGANLARRLMRAGHECVVYDVNEAAIGQLESDAAAGSDGTRTAGLANKRIRQLVSGNARKTMKCGRRSLLISTRDRSADICRVFHDAEAATISAND